MVTMSRPLVTIDDHVTTQSNDLGEFSANSACDLGEFCVHRHLPLDDLYLRDELCELRALLLPHSGAHAQLAEIACSARRDRTRISPRSRRDLPVEHRCLLHVGELVEQRACESGRSSLEDTGEVVEER